MLLRNMEQSGELKIVGEAEYMGLARGEKKKIPVNSVVPVILSAVFLC